MKNNETYKGGYTIDSKHYDALEDVPKEYRDVIESARRKIRVNQPKGSIVKLQSSTRGRIIII